jgi:hypothetical protein
MSDRLTELQRQRALVQVHLSWLDQEIAAAKGIPAPANLNSLTPQANSSPPEALTVAATADADSLLAQYGNETTTTVQSVRKGCFVAFGLLFVLFGLVVYGFYLYHVSHL